MLSLFLLGGSFSAQVEGSADDQVAGSGNGGMDGGDDDMTGDDDDIASGFTPPPTKCFKLRGQMEKKPMPGAYVPRCTNDGLFEKIQCHGSTGECWCVDKMGHEISGTVTKAPNRPDCDYIAPIKPVKPQGGYDEDLESGPTHTDPNEEDIFDKEEVDPKNKIDPIPDSEVEIINNGPNDNEEIDNNILQSKQEAVPRAPLIGQPGILAAIIGGAVVGLLCAVLLVMFIVYRMRKKDEGSYALDEPKRSPQHAYTRAKNQEFFA